MHIQSSCGVLNYPEFGGDYIRTGIALYGMRSAESCMDRSRCELKPILSLKARIATVKELKPGESAGYNFSFTAASPTKTATLTIRLRRRTAKSSLMRYRRCSNQRVPRTDYWVHLHGSNHRRHYRHPRCSSRRYCYIDWKLRKRKHFCL